MITRKRQRQECKGDSSSAQTKTVSIKKIAVPFYLHESEFYLSLQDDDDDILVPSDCLKMDDTVNNNEDLCFLLLTLRFWVAPSITSSIFAYALGNKFKLYEMVLSEFYKDFPSLECIKAVVEAPKKQLMYQAVVSGIIELVEYLHSLGHAWPEQTCVIITRSGNLMLLKSALARGCPLKAEACRLAARRGNLEWLKFLHESGCPWEEDTCTAAIDGNHLDCLMYAHENGCPWNDDADDPEPEDMNHAWRSLNVCTFAAFQNRLECLRYVHQQGVPMVRELYYGAVRKNAVACIKYAYDQGLPLYPELACVAAQFGQLELLEFLHERNMPWNEEVTTVAAAYGQLECLKYIMAHGGTWAENFCTHAVNNGEFEILFYALRNGCPPSPNMFRIPDPEDFMRVLEVFVELNLPWEAVPEAPLCAIMQLFFPALTFMIEHGCPWHPLCAELIACTGRADLLHIFHEKGCPLFTNEEDKHAVCASAIVNNSLDCLRYGHTHGCTIPPTACDELMKLKRYHVECFKYAHQHGGCKLYKNYTEQAARDGQLELLKYLHEQGCKWDAKAAVAAAKEGHAECLEYILRNGCAHSKDIIITLNKHENKVCDAVAKKYGCV